jgi:hypothetical protein
MSPLQFCLSVFLGIDTNPKQKDFFLIRVRDFLNNPIYSLGRSLRQNLDKTTELHFHRTSNFMQGLKSAILATF